jgi:micrococcal nuclease
MIATNRSRRPARPHRTPGRPAPRVAGIGLLALLAMVVLVLAGCRPDRAPRLATSPAERATWPAVPADAIAAKVERVVDGDTFMAAIAGRNERIRLIGVDTPETVDPDRPVQPYGKEASNFAKHMLNGRTVRLVGDVEARDRYGRLLAYVWLPDGTFWNALLAAEGYAQLITIPPDVTYAGLFRRLVDEARSANRGLWSGRTP